MNKIHIIWGDIAENLHSRWHLTFVNENMNYAYNEKIEPFLDLFKSILKEVGFNDDLIHLFIKMPYEIELPIDVIEHCKKTDC